MSENQDRVQQAGYSRAQFEMAYRAICQMCHGLKHMNIQEVKRWVVQITDQEALTQEQEDGRSRTLSLLDNLNQFRESMKVTGIPPVPEVRLDPRQDPPRQ